MVDDPLTKGKRSILGIVGKTSSSVPKWRVICREWRQGPLWIYWATVKKPMVEYFEQVLKGNHKREGTDREHHNERTIGLATSNQVQFSIGVSNLTYLNRVVWVNATNGRKTQQVVYNIDGLHPQDICSTRAIICHSTSPSSTFPNYTSSRFWRPRSTPRQLNLGVLLSFCDYYFAL